ncbi:hypothetical protein BU24DRAFT_427970 [Aaosphaeria arxii CBS 175.79]|uniref:Uncharacterized protein n=1 Tax=Aaosphaeria arxii CBS 175.79 TaxID=1450172 RepID=A0A6A5XAD1_9PLEO|nr:uncharacterized protein BU24DRAFT_427970 [Aaosphaeria arxii CBS 175.79]KAF2009938.1 hypothetical protein BU24DRAFT_427970 [Aaosphaeria arxii CBS 175.79]
MSTKNIILPPLTLPEFLCHVADTQPDSGVTILIICSTREAFLGTLSQALTEQQPEEAKEIEALRRLTVPTLQNLLTAKHIKVVFCATVQHLLAYLTGLQLEEGRGVFRPESTGANARIIVVNPLTLHIHTPLYSAQGLSRTFAAAAEAASREGVAKLLVVECIRMHGDDEMDQMEGLESLATVEEGTEQSSFTRDNHDPWEEEVPILNVSARRFGSGGSERLWAGRTVKVKRVAARWFRFQQKLA